MRRALVVLLLVGACIQDGGTMIGTVVAVEGGLVEVTSFTVLVEGDQVEFLPLAEGVYDFPLAHLRAHLLDGTPIRIGWERRGDHLVALSLADA